MILSHLHARRKGHAQADDDLDHDGAPVSGGLSKGKGGGRRKGTLLLSAELRWALLAVVAFLSLGLILGYFLLHHQHRKVILHAMRDPWAHGRAAVLRGRVGFRHHFYSGSPRYVTVVIPSVVRPSGRTDRLEAIQDTWGPGARAVYVVHNVSEFTAASHAVIGEGLQPEDPYAYPQLLLVPPEIGVDDGLPRLYHVIREVYERIRPDFAFFVNDHTFVIPEHLCKYLERRNPSHDLYSGRALTNGKGEVFNSGAAGYVLSRQTMKRMIEKWDEKDPECWVPSDGASKWIQGNPGLVTVRCLKSLRVSAVDTRAAHKWHRFHAFPLTRVVSGSVDEWYLKKHKGIAKATAGTFSESYETLLSGEDCCSMDTVSFHYVEYMESRALFSVRQALLEDPHMTDHELMHAMMSEWPQTKQEVGGYNRGLPKEGDKEAWEPILKVVRKISTRHTQRDC